MRVQLVKMKGRVACEISTCECLIAAEAIFKGIFTDLEPAEAVAVLCSLVNQHKIPLEEEPRPGLVDLGDVPTALKDAVRVLEELTLELGELQLDMKASQMPASSYLGVSIRPSLSAVRPLPSAL
jgi:superfamily II RNA helicase